MTDRTRPTREARPRAAANGAWLAAPLLALACASEPSAPPVPIAPAVPAVPAAEPPAAEEIATAWTTTRSGRYTVGWRPVGGPVPVNEPFEIDVYLCSDAAHQQPLAGATVRVTAWMPDHMHGMGRQPQAAEVEPGRHRVKGLLLHMEGAWQLFVDVTSPAGAERAEFALTLE